MWIITEKTKLEYVLFNLINAYNYMTGNNYQCTVSADETDFIVVNVGSHNTGSFSIGKDWQSAIVNMTTWIEDRVGYNSRFDRFEATEKSKIDWFRE